MGNGMTKTKGLRGKRSYRKGYLGEYKARKLLEKMGYKVVWQKEDPNKPDIRVVAKKHPNGIDKIPVGKDYEVKYRSSIPKSIYRWLEEKGADVLLVKRVNKKDGRSYPWLKIERFGE